MEGCIPDGLAGSTATIRAVMEGRATDSIASTLRPGSQREDCKGCYEQMLHDSVASWVVDSLSITRLEKQTRGVTGGSGWSW